jgi:hypothetical protein
MVGAKAIKAAVEGLSGPLGSVIERFADGKLNKGQALVELTKEVQTAASVAEGHASAAIVAEARGESWLQRNWRPIGALTMVYQIACFPVLFMLGYDVSELAAAYAVIPSVLYVGVFGCFGGYTALRSWVDKKAAIPGLEALQKVMTKKKNR